MKKLIRIMTLLLALLMVFSSCARNGGDTTEPEEETTGTIVSDDIIPPEEGDPLKEKINYLEGYVKFQSKKGTQAAPVYDIQQMYIREVLGKSHAHTMMQETIDAGYTRMYITVPGDGLPAFSATRDNANTAMRDGRYERNVAACNGNIMKFYNDIAHEYGIKMIAIYKPYEGGGGLSIPAGQIADNCDWYEDTIGGRRIYFDNFVEKHPEMRLVRRDDGYIVDPNKYVTKIESVFVLDKIFDMNGKVQASNYAGSFTAVTAAQIQSLLSNSEGIKLYVSPDNHKFTAYEGDMTITWTEEVRDYYDANGFLKIEDANVYVMTITGLNLSPDTYIAMEIPENVNTKLRTIPYSNINIFSGNEKLTTSVTHFVRDVWGHGGSAPYKILWGYEREPVHTQGAPYKSTWTDNMGYTRTGIYYMFTKYGFEFEYAGAGNGGEGWSTAKVYGIKAGKPQYVAGALCEGYAEVRQHWLNYTIYLLDDCNFDGIEYRMLGHSTFITDPINYGYNQPIVDEYKKRFNGVDISDPSVEITEEMYINIMIIRGDFFMMFLEEVDKYTEEHDKFFGMHLIDAYADTSKYMESLKHTGMNSLISPYRPKIIINWKKCIDMCDEISLKEYTWNNYKVETCIEIKQYAYQKGKTCWTNVSRVMGEQNLEYCTKVDNDPTVGGIMWYEYPGEGAIKGIYEALGYERVEIPTT